MTNLVCQCQRCGHKWNPPFHGLKGHAKVVGGVLGGVAAATSVLNPLFMIPLIAAGAATAVDGADDIGDFVQRNCPKCGCSDFVIV